MQSRTTTEPSVTRVSVPSQRSSVSHRVPRTVATLSAPWVRKRPLLSLPHRLRLRFLATLLADARFGAEQRPGFGPLRYRSVMPLPVLDCLTSKRPPLNVPVCECPRVSSALTSVTEPFVVSSSDPVGTLTLPVSGTNVFVPLSLTLDDALDVAPATTVWPRTGEPGPAPCTV